MAEPFFDKSTGWWCIQLKNADGTRTKKPLAKQEGWVKGRSGPKRTPDLIKRMARPYQDREIQVKHGVDVASVRAADLKDFLTEYQSHHAVEHRPNSVRVLSQAVGHFLEFCERRKVKTVQGVTVAFCEAFMEAARRKGLSRAYVHVIKGSLSPAWSRGVRARHFDLNPWKLSVGPTLKNRHAEFWSKEELRKLIDAAGGWVRDLILVAVNTGPRIDSLLQLKWDAVRFDRGVVLYDSKTGQYEVPMNDTARGVLQRINGTSKADLVFPPSRKDTKRTAAVVYVAIRTAVRAAGIPEKGSYCHILRHTFASHAVMDGVPLTTVSKWLGHTTINMTMRYSHLCKTESQRQMNAFNLGHDPLDRAAPASGTTPRPPDG